MFIAKLSPLAFLIGSVTTYAAVPPDAGSLGNNIRQETQSVLPSLAEPSLLLPSTDNSSVSSVSEESSTRITLKKISFSGDYNRTTDVGISSNDLNKLVLPWLGKSISFEDMQKMVNQITHYFHSRGLIATQALLPPQTVKDGNLNVYILSGKYDIPDILNKTDVRSELIRRIAQATTPEGDIVKNDELQRLALLLGEIPGTKSQVSLAPGSKKGTTALGINLSPTERVGGYFGVDNQGDPTTGRSRVMLGGYVNNIVGTGDLLSVNLMDSWEHSNLFTGDIDYSSSINGYGSRIGLNYSHLNYRFNFMGEKFSGDSNNWMLYVTHPLVRKADTRIDVRLDGGQQYLTDKYPATLFGGALDDEGYKRVSQGRLTVSGASSALMAGGVSGFSISGSQGQTIYRNDTARLLGFADEAGTAGRFVRMNYQFSHEQQLTDTFSFFTRLNGQLANHNLDTSQKLLLGGPSAVRAYDVGDGSVDNGNMFTAELRKRWDSPIPAFSSISPDLTVAAFYDQGWGQQYKNNKNQVYGGHLTDKNNLNLSGAGIYAVLEKAGNYSLSLTWAHRTGNSDPVSGHSDDDRFWFTAVKNF